MNFAVTFDEHGEAIDVKNVDGTEVTYDKPGMTIKGARLRTSYEGVLPEPEGPPGSKGVPSFIVEFEENGRAVDVKNVDRTPVRYHPESKLSIRGAQLSSTASTCCWRMVFGRLMCREEFCA
jgi:hypothetical protein